MGSIDCAPAVYIYRALRGSLVEGQKEPASPCPGLCHAVVASSGRTNRTGEPRGDSFIRLAQAGSDYPAVAVRSRRSKSDMSMVEEPAEASAYRDRGRP